MSVLTEAIRNALTGSDMETATSDVKQLVCDELSRADPRARIKKTGYFNHTYIPDVVMQRGAEPTREVYLRFLAPDNAGDDVARVGNSGPVLFDLSTATSPARVEETTRSLSSALRDFPLVLVTDTEATERIRPGETTNFVERLVVSNLVSAGRGLLRERQVEEVVTVSRAGFEGATTLEAEPVRAAVDLVRSVLPVELERRFEKSLQLLWWAGGGALTAFPQSLLDTMQLDPADAREFLGTVFNSETIEDSGFWDRLSSRITFDILTSVGDIRNSGNLNRLMRSFAKRLALSHVVLDRHDRPFPPDDQLTWQISDNFIILRGPDWTCRFTPHGNRFSKRQHQGDLLTVQDATDRTENLIVNEAVIQDHGMARIVHLTRTIEAISEYQRSTFQRLVTGFPGDVGVRSVSLQIGVHQLTAEFDRMMVGAVPDATVAIMAITAARLLAGVSGRDGEALERFLGEKEEVGLEE